MTSLVGRSVVVRVPATSANLGPGFDTLGLALSHYDELIVTAVEGTGVTIVVTGVGAGIVATDESNLVIQAIQHCFTHFAQHLPALHVQANNIIPHGGGLGSSAAAIVSGVMAAKGLLAGIVEMDAATLLILATELEGHPDNVAPALLGGLTIAWSTETGPQAKKLIVHRGVSPLVCVPDSQVSTAHARSLQPETVPYADAVYNISRAALLIAALAQSPELLLEATGDRLHQDYRAAAMPQTTELIRMLRSHGHAAVVSGAGPSVLVLADDPARRLEAMALVKEHAAASWECLLLAVDFKGATVNEHQVEVTA
ncbi:homoserine kinase [Rhodoglobus vestalii]|uniref:Homoserine kinase n=1 Tax=Rhodoglobus vestalii TaxID=193384 RepID=A0A8H2K4K3_9MICO|nr:homoserine kinase [Rhodoglobus vestalii]TQO19055.1 homoserine kinase [Rhodoglobus vestalii]